mgnify:CR=1 FL=1
MARSWEIPSGLQVGSKLIVLVKMWLQNMRKVTMEVSARRSAPTNHDKMAGVEKENAPPRRRQPEGSDVENRIDFRRVF